MKSTGKQDLYFEALGDDFESFMSDYDVERRLWLVFEQLLYGHLLDGCRVLEVGSGTGRFSRRIIEIGGELCIVDIGNRLVQDVSRAFSCLGTTGDACELPFSTNTFDLVISSECIEHTPDPIGAIREMCRVCRPGGRVCITTPNRVWFPIAWGARAFRLRKFAGPEKWVFPFQARRAMAGAGMVGIRLGGCHAWPFQLRFTRPVLRRLDLLSKWFYPFMINFGAVGWKRSTGR